MPKSKKYVRYCKLRTGSESERFYASRDSDQPWQDEVRTDVSVLPAPAGTQPECRNAQLQIAPIHRHGCIESDGKHIALVMSRSALCFSVDKGVGFTWHEKLRFVNFHSSVLFSTKLRLDDGFRTQSESNLYATREQLLIENFNFLFTIYIDVKTLQKL